VTSPFHPLVFILVVGELVLETLGFEGEYPEGL